MRRNLCKVRDVLLIIGSYVGIFIIGRLLGNKVTWPATARLLGLDE